MRKQTRPGRFLIRVKLQIMLKTRNADDGLLVLLYLIEALIR